MTNEEIIDYILYDRLYPIISSIDRFNFEDGNIKVIFKYEDKYFEALDFINKQKYDIILSS